MTEIFRTANVIIRTASVSEPDPRPIILGRLR